MLTDSIDIRQHIGGESKPKTSEKVVSLGQCNDYLIKCMEILTVKKNSVVEKIDNHQKQKHAMEKKIKTLQQKLVTIHELLVQETEIVHNIDQTMRVTEDQYNEIASHSNQLLKEFQENTRNILSQSADWSYDKAQKPEIKHIISSQLSNKRFPH